MLGSVLLFLNLGTPEIILIMFVALLLFGGEKLPDLARGLGRGIRDFKDASEGVKRELTNQINSYEEKGTTKAESNTPVVNEITEESATTETPKPLIDTSPVAGTVPLGGHSVADEILEEKHGDTEHTDSSTEPDKTTNE
jgi:sec-independent protein translocase protein TatA